MPDRHLRSTAGSGDIGQSHYWTAIVTHATKKPRVLGEGICFGLMTGSLQAHEQGIIEGGRISIRTAARKKE